MITSMNFFSKNDERQMATIFYQKELPAEKETKLEGEGISKSGKVGRNIIEVSGTSWR